MQDSKKDKSDMKHKLLKHILCGVTYLFMLQHAFAAEQSGSMDAAGMFGKNASSDGQITICSDSLSYSQDAKSGLQVSQSSLHIGELVSVSWLDSVMLLNFRP